MLDSFKGAGRCATMDLAYMGDVIDQIGRKEWDMNMVGTVTDNRTGAGPEAKEKKKTMRKVNYESIMFQHDSLPLTYKMWPDNNIVCTLSNFYPKTIIEAGIKRKRNFDGVRERDSTAVSCPIQNKYYSETFHWIDKGNGSEATYDIGTQTNFNVWIPKLAFWYFKMDLNNAYKIYDVLVTLHTTVNRSQEMGGAIELSTTFFRGATQCGGRRRNTQIDVIY